jgi:hypothetical protein
MKNLFILSILFCLAIKCFAQEDLYNGYIIKNSEDTIYGQIVFISDANSCRQCVFVENKLKDKVQYTPDDLIGYRFIESKYFVSRKVIHKIPDMSEPKEELLFVELLISGKVNIYCLRDDYGDHYYIDKGDGNLFELKNDEREVYIGDVKYIQESKQYIGVLKTFFQDAPEISKKAEDISLGTKPLIQITEKYQKAVCPDEKCMVFVGQKPKVKFKFGVNFAINKNLNDLGYRNDLDVKIKSGYNPSIGLFLDANIPFISQNFYIEYEPSYIRSNYYSSSTINTSNSLYNSRLQRQFAFTSCTSYDIKLITNSISNSLMLRETFPMGKFGISLMTGMFYDIVLSSDYKENIVTMDSTWAKYNTETSYSLIATNSTSSSYSENPYKNSDFGIILGIGTKYFLTHGNAIRLDLRYELGFHTDGFENEKNKQLFSLVLGYEF